MTTKKTKSGYEHDLREAENAIVSAGPDLAALALAQRRHAEAIRNYMQGAIVPMFVEMTERSLKLLIAPLVESVDGLRTDVHSAVEGAARLGELEARVDRIDARHEDLDHIQVWRAEADRRLAAIEQANRDGVHTELERIRTELEGVKSILAERPAKREQEYRAIAEKAAEDAVKRLEARDV